MDSHCNSVRIEGTCGGIVLKPTEEIIVTNGIQFCVALEAVDRTLAFDCVGALNIKVIREKNLL